MPSRRRQEALQVTKHRTLSEAFGLGSKGVVSLVGAGGKSTAMFRLAREQADHGRRVIITTTTKIRVPEPSQCDKILIERNPRLLLSRSKEALRDSKRIVIGSSLLRDHKLEGVDADFIAELLSLADVVLVEADGAKGKSLKAPAGHEPVIPGSSTVCVVVMGIDVLSEPLSRESVHRPALVAALSGIGRKDPLTWECVRQVLFHPAGYLGRIPRTARRIVFLNKVRPKEYRRAFIAVKEWDWRRLEAIVAGEAREKRHFTRWM